MLLSGDILFAVAGGRSIVGIGATVLPGPAETVFDEGVGDGPFTGSGGDEHAVAIEIPANTIKKKILFIAVNFAFFALSLRLCVSAVKIP
jgi:hypothetical protein